MAETIIIRENSFFCFDEEKLFMSFKNFLYLFISIEKTKWIV